MSLVIINYKFSTFKAKISRNSPLSDILVESLKHFKIYDGDEAINKWMFTNSGVPIALDIPWMFLNLPAGVKLILKEKISAAGNGSDNRKDCKLIKIRFQIPGSSPVIASVNNLENLKKVIDTLNMEFNWIHNDSNATLQVFSKIIKYHDLENHSLKSLGIDGPTSLKLNLNFTSKEAKETSVEKTDKIDIISESKVDNIDEKKETSIDHVDTLKQQLHQLHEVSVFVPSKNTYIQSIQKDNLDDMELKITVDDARKYQNVLSRKAGTLGGPLLTKRLREKYEEELIAKRQPLLECMVRIRFPDRSNIEIAFKPDDTATKIYEVVSKSLYKEDIVFTLIYPHPTSVLVNDNKKLLKDLNFTTKTLLLFNSEYNGQFLKQHLVDNAHDISEADDVRVDQQKIVTESDNIDETIQSTSHSNKIRSSYSDTTKIPKWFKHGKK